MTTDGSAFPVFPTSRVDTDEVVRYLTELSAQGHRVYQDSKQAEVFYIQLSDAHRLRISASGGRSQAYHKAYASIRNIIELLEAT